MFLVMITGLLMFANVCKVSTYLLECCFSQPCLLNVDIITIFTFFPLDKIWTEDLSELVCRDIIDSILGRFTPTSLLFPFHQMV